MSPEFSLASLGLDFFVASVIDLVCCSAFLFVLLCHFLHDDANKNKNSRLPTQYVFDLRSLRNHELSLTWYLLSHKYITPINLSPNPQYFVHTPHYYCNKQEVVTD